MRQRMAADIYIQLIILKDKQGTEIQKSNTTLILNIQQAYQLEDRFVNLLKHAKTTPSLFTIA